MASGIESITVFNDLLSIFLHVCCLLVTSESVKLYTMIDSERGGDSRRAILK